MPDSEFSIIQTGYWKDIPSLAETVLASSKLSNDTNLAGDGFHISEENVWQIQDRFIFNISNRLGFDRDKVLRALRLFVLHEGLHVYQKLTNYTSQNIGRFPRVLEEADYIADVWAMLHEFAYCEVYRADDTKDIKKFFLELVEIATKTMWAFDDLDLNNEEMQIRRVNRYLIWYWNYLRIEDRNIVTLEDIINTLALKPWVELKGLDIRAQTQRTIFKLTNFKRDELEIGLLSSNGKIIRIANSGGLKIDDLISGFRERDGSKILRQLKSMYDQVRD